MGKTQTGPAYQRFRDSISVLVIGNIAGTTQTLVQYVDAPGRVLKLAAALRSGTSITMTLQINGVPVTGLTAVVVTTADQEFDASALNVYDVGDKIEMVLSTPVGSPQHLSFTVVRDGDL